VVVTFITTVFPTVIIALCPSFRSFPIFAILFPLSCFFLISLYLIMLTWFPRDRYTWFMMWFLYSCSISSGRSYLPTCLVEAHSSPSQHIVRIACCVTIPLPHMPIWSDSDDRPELFGFKTFRPRLRLLVGIWSFLNHNLKR
jgi:hypothetical protein